MFILSRILLNQTFLIVFLIIIITITTMIIVFLVVGLICRLLLNVRHAHRFHLSFLSLHLQECGRIRLLLAHCIILVAAMSATIASNQDKHQKLHDLHC